MSNWGLPYGETVVVHGRQKTGVDAYNDDVFQDVNVPVDGCAIWDGSSLENTQGRDQTSSDMNVLMPAGAPIPALIDAMTVRGLRYEVDGKPRQELNPITGDNAGVLVYLNAVEG